MRKTTMRTTRVLLLLLLVAGQAQTGDKSGNSASKEDTVKLYHLPEIVVTATRMERNPMDIGRSVTILQGYELRNSLSTSVGEALSLQSGIYVVGSGQTPGAIQSLFMRGAGSHQTAVFVDDYRITDPSGVNGALDLSELSTGEVDRIEIVRGSHSTSYGSSAIGGVVNVITEKRSAPGISLTTDVQAGTFGRATSMFVPGLNLSYSSNLGFYATGGIQYEQLKGLDATIDTLSDPQLFRSRDRDHSDKLSLSTRMGYRNKEIEVYAGYRSLNHHLDVDKGAYRDDDNYRTSFDRKTLTYGGSWNMNDQWSVKLLGGLSSMRRIAVDDSSVVDRFGRTDQTYSSGEWSGRTSTHELQTTVRFGKNNGLFGVGFYQESMTTKSHFYSRSAFGEFTFDTDLSELGLTASTASVYTHIDLQGATIQKDLKTLSVGIGARLNSHSSFGENATYAVSPAFRISDGLLLYLSHSTGFSSPSLYQLFSPEQDYVSGITRGNLRLKPEVSKSYEMGFKYSDRKTFKLSGAIYQNVVRNAIEYVYLWEQSIPLGQIGTDWMRNDFRGDTYLNIGTSRATGFEFEWEIDVTRRFSVAGNLTYVDGLISYESDAPDNTQTKGHHVQLYNNGAFLDRNLESRGLVRRPSTGHVSFEYRPDTFISLRLSVRHVSERSDVFYDLSRGPYGALGTVPVKDYTLVDVLSRVDLSKSLMLAVRVENMFDVRYAEIHGYTTRGRGAYLYFRYTLDPNL